MPERRTRGLGSLISSTGAGMASASADIRLVDIPVSSVMPSSRQPRLQFNEKALASLAESIQRHGLLQPVIVRPAGDRFELIAGERRWRAAKLAGLETIRAVSRPSSDAEMLTLSIIENLQRENLDPIEEATAYRTLTEQLALTQEQIAAYVGKDRTTISNTMRLLDLPRAIQAKLTSGELTAGHARVLLAVTDPAKQHEFAERAANGGMSVRELESLVRRSNSAARARGRAAKSAHLVELERQLIQRLGVPVEITEGRRGGKLVIRFRSNQDFMRILEVVGVHAPDL